MGALIVRPFIPWLPVYIVSQFFESFGYAAIDAGIWISNGNTTMYTQIEKAALNAVLYEALS